MTSMRVCDTEKSIVSFPASIDSRVSVSKAMYDSVEEPLTVEFKWATRATVPKFEQGNKGVIDEVGHGGLGINTVHFNNIIYNLYSVGLYASSHNSWLFRNRATRNNADLILIFNIPNQLIKAKYDFIFLVIPILETSSGEAPSYLSGIGSPGAMPTQGYSLSSCMPSISSQFAYYATCLSSTDSKTAKNGIVFLSLDGIDVGSSIMSSIQSAPGLGGSFAKISEAPVNDQFNITSFLRQGGSVLSSTDITRYVLTTRVLFDTERTKNMGWVKGASAVRTDSQSSYKCVQFDPENDLDKDKNVTIDLTSGEILSKVLEERNIVIQTMNTLDEDKARGNVKLVPYFIGTILALFFLFSAVIVVSKGFSTPVLNVTPPVGTPSVSANAREFFSRNWVTILVGGISIILGAVLGVLIALNGVMSSGAATRESVTAAVANSRANMTN